MSLPDQYLLTTKNLDAFFNAIINAQPPKKFTQKFLEQLEFKSTNDRLLIGVLKAIGFLDAEGVPQSKYYEFIDQTQSKVVLADAIREAYSDLFAVNKNANTLTESEVKNKLKTLLQGAKSENVLHKMANTFRALCDYADFQELKNQNESIATRDNEPKQENYNQNNSYANSNSDTKERDSKVIHELKAIQTEMHYNIQIHLPETRDIAVYEAIFKALKEHLL